MFEVPLTAKRNVGRGMIIVEMHTKDVVKGSYREGSNVKLGVGCHDTFKERNSLIVRN